MTRPWVRPLVRTGVYLYFATGTALLLNAGWTSGLRYSADKGLFATLLLVLVGVIFVILALGNWDTYGRPLSARKWVILCLASTLGFLYLSFASRSFGGSGA